jgi:hypothetical protein
MPRRRGRGIGSRLLGAGAVVASTLMITVLVGGTGHLDSAGALPGTSVEVCKAGNVTGSFPFSLNNVPSFSIQVGHCVIKAVPSGDNLVKELVIPAGTTGLQSISVTPTSASVAHQVKNSSSLAGYAKVNIASGATVTVTFTNAPHYGQLKVCKVAAANSPSLIGLPFNFLERTVNGHVGPFSVNAGWTPDTSCGGLTRYRVGRRVNISEAATAGTQVTNIDVTGGTLATANYGAGTATAIVGPSNVTTVVNYTNGIGLTLNSLIEVCVQSGDSNVQGTFYFDLNSGLWSTTVSITVGQGGVSCTGDIPAPPTGQITVTEESNPTYDVSAVAAIPTSALVSDNLAMQKATFSVTDPRSGATTAIFTNSTVTG